MNNETERPLIEDAGVVLMIVGGVGTGGGELVNLTSGIIRGQADTALQNGDVIQHDAIMQSEDRTLQFVNNEVILPSTIVLIVGALIWAVSRLKRWGRKRLESKQKSRQN